MLSSHPVGNSFHKRIVCTRQKTIKNKTEMPNYYCLLITFNAIARLNHSISICWYQQFISKYNSITTPDHTLNWRQCDFLGFRLLASTFKSISFFLYAISLKYYGSNGDHLTCESLISSIFQPTNIRDRCQNSIGFSFYGLPLFRFIFDYFSKPPRHISISWPYKWCQ